MREIQVLDCTLRDGGYCNQWRFGHKNIRKMVHSLDKAGIDIIECGFLTGKVPYDEETTLFTDVRQTAGFLPENREGKLFVCMMNCGEYDPEQLPQRDGAWVDGIRIAFHKKDMEAALKMAQIIREKGYLVFLQGMVSMGYTDQEFLDLIHRANRIKPYAFYIVDSFGVMKQNDLVRFFYLVENNLDQEIHVGYHAHNNMQLAYSNAQGLANIVSNRKLIVDSSLYGMGRGAGNLNTELFVGYLNDLLGQRYDKRPLLKMIDQVIEDFRYQGKWGYSLPNYLSAAHDCHPNYADYLDNKKTLTVEAMDEIFSKISDEKRHAFDKSYIEQLYLEYMESGEGGEESPSGLRELIAGRRVLVIAPGPSAQTQRERIAAFAAQEDVLTVSVNFDYPHWDVDLIFLSNLRRYQDLARGRWDKTMVTSNVPCPQSRWVVEYAQLLNQEEPVRDNAGMMLLKLLIRLGAGEIVVAGMDGYSHDLRENYAEEELLMVTSPQQLDLMNRGMERVLEEFSRQAKLTFLTQPLHLQLEEGQGSERGKKRC